MSEDHKVDAPTEQESDYTPVSFFRLLAIPACLVLAVLGLSLLHASFSGRTGQIHPAVSVLLLFYIAFVLTIIAARQK